VDKMRYRGGWTLWAAFSLMYIQALLAGVIVLSNWGPTAIGAGLVAGILVLLAEQLHRRGVVALGSAIAMEMLLVLGSVFIVASYRWYNPGFIALIGVAVVILLSVVVTKDPLGRESD
jgi:hypothetical protein